MEPAAGQSPVHSWPYVRAASKLVEAEPEDYPFGVRVTALDTDGNRVSLRQKMGSQ